jgi:hypothetical protein
LYADIANSFLQFCRRRSDGVQGEKCDGPEA